MRYGSQLLRSCLYFLYWLLEWIYLCLSAQNFEVRNVVQSKRLKQLYHLYKLFMLYEVIGCTITLWWKLFEVVSAIWIQGFLHSFLNRWEEPNYTCQTWGKIISTENCHYLVSANSKAIQINLDDTRILLFTEFSFLLVAWLNMFNCMKCHPWREKLQTNPPSLV